ncbi:MAG: four-helix bundle copper-binding protein [Rikenellaceae bacterium]|nr:four-helix bundle copper-binding protein [Rikenellaceae bacterium]
MDEKMKDLVHKLAECVHMCNDCFNACLDEEDVKKMKECIRLDKECAEICSATQNLIYGGSHFKKEVLSLCKTICRQCADECKKYPMDHCQNCAKACEACESACSDFLNDSYDGVC